MSSGAPDEEVAVTVLIVTFNHAAYIARAIDSALDQAAPFRYEIIISEDASSDGTRDIVLDYAHRYPGRIRCIMSEHNIRSNLVVRRGLREAKGRYLAMLDGDDYWTTGAKLRTQAAFLDANPHCAAVFHNAVTVVDGIEQPAEWTSPDQATTTTLARLWDGNPFATCAGMLRTGYIRHMPEWYDLCFPITDWPLYLMCARHGDIAFAGGSAGAYRLHDGGMVSSRRAAERLDMIEGFYIRMSKTPEFAGDAALHAGYTRYFFDWAKSYRKQGQFLAALDCLRRAWRGGGIGTAVSRSEAMRLASALIRDKLTGSVG